MTQQQPGPPGPATIHDVARLAGVSIKTVSRVVNDEPHVRETLRAQVARAVFLLGYERNEAAAALSRGRRRAQPGATQEST